MIQSFCTFESLLYKDLFAGSSLQIAALLQAEEAGWKLFFKKEFNLIEVACFILKPFKSYFFVVVSVGNSGVLSSSLFCKASPGVLCLC